MNPPCRTEMARAHAGSDESGFRRNDSGSRRDVEDVLRRDEFAKGGSVMYFAVVLAEKANGGCFAIAGKGGWNLGPWRAEVSAGSLFFPSSTNAKSLGRWISDSHPLLLAHVWRTQAGSKIGDLALGAHQLRLVPRGDMELESAVQYSSRDSESKSKSTGSRRRYVLGQGSPRLRYRQCERPDAVVITVGQAFAVGDNGGGRWWME